MPPHEGKEEAEEVENHVQWDSEEIPLRLQDMEVGARAQVMGLAFLSSLVPEFWWEYAQSMSTGDAGHATGCSGIARELCRQLVLLFLPSKHEIYGNCHPLHSRPLS